MRWRELRKYKFDRLDWIRYAAAVIGAIAGQIIWTVGVPRTGDAWLDGLASIAAMAVGLSTVVAVASALFNKAKDRVTLEDIKMGQEKMRDEIIAILNKNTNLLETYLPLIAKALGANVPTPSGDKAGAKDDTDASG